MMFFLNFNCQVERGETLFTCQKLRDEADQQIRHLQDTHQQESARFKELIQTLELTITHLEQRVQVLQEKDNLRISLQLDAVKEALIAQRQEQIQELARLQESFAKERDSLKQEYTRVIEQLSSAQTKQQEEYRKQQEHAAFQAQQTALQHEHEVKRLKEDYTSLQTQMIVLKEKANHQLQEEKTIHEKSLSEQLAASLQVQASLKTEMANMLQHLHLEENKRRQESEQQFMRMRDAMVTQHTLEIETLKEKHMRELKRLRAELDVQHEDQLNKVKHMHEQVSRCVAIIF